MLIFRALRFPTRNQVKGAGNPVEHFSARQRQAKTQCTEVSNTGSLRGTGCFDAKKMGTYLAQITVGAIHRLPPP